VVGKLKSLVGTRSPEQIEDIQKLGATGADVEVLSAPNGAAIAAYVASKPSVSALAVSPVG